MKKLPESEIYEDGLEYWPYKKSLQGVFDYVCKNAAQNGTFLDIMCGPGYLLGKIAEKRKDLSLLGVDIDKRYIPYGRKKYTGVTFEQGDVLTWHPKSQFDVVVCTGSLHHIEYDKQEEAVKNIASMVKPGGFVIISDCYIDDYSNEIDRKLSASRLGYEYLIETIKNNASDPVVGWTIDILYNDVLKQEFKTSLEKRLPIFDKYFKKIETIKSWPDTKSGYGDYISICEPV